MYGEVNITVERCSHGRWKCRVLIWLYLPEFNRRGRMLKTHSPHQGWIRIGGVDNYKTVKTQTEAVRLAVAEARSWIRQNRAAQNAYVEQLKTKRTSNH